MSVHASAHALSISSDYSNELVDETKYLLKSIGRIMSI